jgi:hypothetical protein
MLEANVVIVKELKKFVTLVGSRPDLLQYFKKGESSFIRHRKLPFETLVLLIAKLCKKTLSLELEVFFEEINKDSPCSVSAFTQQRKKLSDAFFYCWNRVLWFNFYLHYGDKVKRWKGYRVIAADGSSISLVNNKSLSEYFGGQTNQHKGFVLGKSYYCYDVLNELILFPRLSPYRYSEMEMAYDSIDHLESDMLMIYDRNFSTYKMIALHQWQEREIKFIIRAKDSLNIVKSFIKSGQTSAIITIPPTPSAIKGLRKSGYLIDQNTVLRVRLIRVELEKSVEVLLTNLWEEDEHPVSEFKDLYFLRWGVETNIGFQKNVLQLESFSGLTVNAVLQDFYATVFMTNLHSLLIKHAQQTVSNTMTDYKYPRKVNHNKSLGRLKRRLILLFIEQDPEPLLRELHELFIKETVPIRKARSYLRVKKNTHSKSKHRTFTNFKPSF